MRKSFSRSNRSMPGFSLVELMIAMAIFLVVGGAAVSLIKKHAPLYTTQQNQAGLNIGMRNVVAQMQIDVVNAGSGYYPGANMPDWPVGLTIQNGPTTACFNATTFNYTGGCFDTLRVIEADSSMPSARPSGDSGGLTDANTASTDLYLIFSPTPTAAQLATWAGNFTSGSQILLVQGVSGQPHMATAVLTAAGAAAGNSIHLVHSATTTVNCPTGSATQPGIPAAGGDTLGIYDNDDCARYTNSFSHVTDYVLKLQPTIYSVDAVTDPTSPRLVRQVGLGGTPNVIADQIIGFRVQAYSTQNNAYNVKASDFGSDWASIKAIRVNLIARTPPSNDPNSTFKNSLDQGPYQVQAISVVINPRNLSMQ